MAARPVIGGRCSRIDPRCRDVPRNRAPGLPLTPSHLPHYDSRAGAATNRPDTPRPSTPSRTAAHCVCVWGGGGVRGEGGGIISSFSFLLPDLPEALSVWFLWPVARAANLWPFCVGKQQLADKSRRIGFIGVLCAR